MGLTASPSRKGGGGAGCAKRSTFFISSHPETQHYAGNARSGLSAHRSTDGLSPAVVRVSDHLRARGRFNAQMTHSAPDGSTGGVAGALEPVVRDLDQFDGTPRPLFDELAADAAELGDRLGHQARAFVRNRVGQPLVVEAV